jgi:hypothetical protein
MCGLSGRGLKFLSSNPSTFKTEGRKKEPTFYWNKRLWFSGIHSLSYWKEYRQKLAYLEPKTFIWKIIGLFWTYYKEIGLKKYSIDFRNSVTFINQYKMSVIKLIKALYLLFTENILPKIRLIINLCKNLEIS